MNKERRSKKEEQSTSKDELQSIIKNLAKTTADLSKSKTLLRCLFESVPDATLLVNPDGLIVHADKPASALFGYNRKELLGKRIEMLIPEGFRYRHTRHRSTYTTHPQTGKMGAGLQVSGLRKDGSEFPVDVFVTPVPTEEGNYVMSHVHDLSESAWTDAEVEAPETIAQVINVSQDLESTVEAYACRQAGVAELGQRALAGIDLSTLMDEAVALVARILHVEYSKVLELMPGEDTLLLRAGVGWKKGYVGRKKVKAKRNSQAGYTLLSTEPVIVEDLRTETRFSSPGLLTEHGVVSGVSVIINNRERMFGVLGAHTTEHRTFTKDDITFLQAVANVLAQALGRKQAEKALRESEEKFRSQYKSIPVPTYTWQKVGEDFRLVQYNDAAISSTRGRVADFLGMKASEMYPDRPDVLEDLSRCFREKTVVKREMEYVLRATGETGLFKANYVFVPPDMVMVHAEDITEHHRAETLLQESEARFRQLANAVPALVWTTAPDGAATYFNDRWVKYTGLTTEQSLGDGWFQVVHPDDQARCLKVWNTSLLNGIPFEMEERYRHASGQYRWILARAEPVRDSAGNITMWFGISTDIEDKKQTENALKEREHAYRTLSENLPGIVYRVFIQENNRMQFFNRTSEAVTGYTPDELLSGETCSLDPLIVPEDRPKVISIVKTAIEQKQTFFLEYRLQHKDGSIRYLLEQGTPIFGAEGQPQFIDGVIFDITERKQAEEALRESNTRVINILESITEAFFALNRREEFTYVNQEAERVLRRSKAELLGKNIWEAFPPAVNTTFQKQYRKAMTEKVSVEYREYYAPFNAWFEVHAYPSEDGLSVYFMDITERKKTEEALYAQAQIMGQIHDSVVATDLDGYVTSWNKGAERLTGYSSKEALGKHISFIYAEDQHDFLQMQVIKPLKEKGNHEVEVRMRRKFGDDIVAHLSLSLLKDTQGTVTGMIGYSMDITERKRAEQALQESEAQYRDLVESLAEGIFIEQKGQLVYVNSAGLRLLERTDLSELKGYTLRDLFENEPANPIEEFLKINAPAALLESRLIGKQGKARDTELTLIHTSYRGKPATQVVARDITEAKRLRQEAQRMERLVALGEFSATIAHEIRNPLGSIGLNLDNLVRRWEVPGNCGRIFANIEHGMARIQSIINGILDFARPTPPKRLKTNLHHVLAMSLDSLRHELENTGIEIVKNYQADHPEVLVDADQIMQVFVNLFSNAKDAMGGGGQLTINTLSDETSIKVEVVDSGKGIPPEELEHIFDPFFTTKKTGIGLGMAVVSRILQEHHAKIFVESEIDVGTKFTIYFPFG